MLWIIGGIIGVLLAIVLVPVLVVGTWFVIMTVTMGIADGVLWVLDGGWKRPARKSRSEATRVRPAMSQVRRMTGAFFQGRWCEKCN